MSEEDNLSESAAFDRLYREQCSPVHRFLRVWLRNSSVADDLTQETFLHFWRRRTAFHPDRGDIRAYLFGIARNKAASWRRENKTTAASLEQTTEPSNCLFIEDALSRLPDDLRTILWLREVDGYSYDELSRILKIPLGTVRSRLHCARQQLRTIWMKEA